jgi:uncharacterized protein YbjT (DUF2867 family)
MILVIGSSGTVGSEVVRQARQAGADVRALVRSPEKGADAEAAGAELAVGDCADPASLDAALGGVDHVFIVLPGAPDQVALETNAIEAVQRAGGAHVVKLSVMGADPSAPVRFGASHGAVEQVLADSGLPHTVLRPTDFMQNVFGWAGTLRSGQVYTPTPDAQIASIDVRDIAAVAVTALTQPGHEGKAYALTGPEALTRREQVTVLAAAAGVEAEVVEVTNEQARDAMLGAGFPEYAVGGLIELNEHVYEPGYASTVADGVREATGHEPRSWEEFARDHAEAL